MRKWIKRFWYLVGGCVFFLIIVLDYFHDYPEKFKIEGISEAYLFKVSGSNPSGCNVLSDSIFEQDLAQATIFLIGIRFKLNYVSVKREHLWDNNLELPGALGHLDTIRALNIRNSLGGEINMDSLQDASLFKDFTFDQVDTWDAHHVNQKGCYEAQTFNSVQNFITYYNGSANQYNLVSSMRDYIFFKVSPSFVSSMLHKSNKLVLYVNNGADLAHSIKFVEGGSK